MKDQQTPNTMPQPDDLRQARQQARLRKRRKLMIKRTIIVVVALLLVALIATAIVVKIVADQKNAKHEKVGFLGVKEIVVEGDTRYTDEELIKASGLYVGQSLLSVNKVKAHDALAAAFPYLETIDVSNASFYVLRIRVTEVPVMAAVEPACATLLQIVVLRVLPDGFTLVGILLVLGAIVWLNLGKENA